MNVSKPRIAYELIIGRVTDRHWREVQKILLRNQMEITVKNVQFLAEIKQIIPRSAIGISGVLKCYGEAERLLSKSSRNLKGMEVLQVLNQYGVKPHQSTVTRWFKPLGGYRKNQEYSPLALKPIFTSAFVYQAMQSIKMPEAN